MSTLSDRDREILDEYESYEDIDDASELADYLNAFAKLCAVGTNGHPGRLLELNGLATDLRQNNISVTEAREVIEEMDMQSINKQYEYRH